MALLQISIRSVHSDRTLRTQSRGWPRCWPRSRTTAASPAGPSLARHGPVGLQPRAPRREEDTGKARWAVSQLTEDGSAHQAPEPVARDIAEQRPKPLAIQAEVHDPGGDVGQVGLPD